MIAAACCSRLRTTSPTGASSATPASRSTDSDGVGVCGHLVAGVPAALELDALPVAVAGQPCREAFGKTLGHASPISQTSGLAVRGPAPPSRRRRSQPELLVGGIRELHAAVLHSAECDHRPGRLPPASACDRIPTGQPLPPGQHRVDQPEIGERRQLRHQEHQVRPVAVVEVEVALEQFARRGRAAASRSCSATNFALVDQRLRGCCGPGLPATEVVVQRGLGDAEASAMSCRLVRWTPFWAKNSRATSWMGCRVSAVGALT